MSSARGAEPSSPYVTRQNVVQQVDSIHRIQHSLLGLYSLGIFNPTLCSSYHLHDDTTDENKERCGADRISTTTEYTQHSWWLRIPSLGMRTPRKQAAAIQ